MRLGKFKLFGVMLIAVSGCATSKVSMPEMCSPYNGKMVCPTTANPDFNDYVCFLPAAIEPLLEKFTK